MRRCECGCGQEVSRPSNRFIHAHNIKKWQSSGPENGNWKDGTGGGEYKQAHRLARRWLGPPPAVCPSCNEERRVEISYVGTASTRVDSRGRPYDPTGRDYVYECHSCDVKRSERHRTAQIGHVISDETREKIRATLRRRHQERMAT